MEEIKRIILDYKPDIDEVYLNYLTIYLYSVQYNKVMADNKTIKDYVVSILGAYPNLCFYEMDHPIVKEIGTDTKGIRHNGDHCLYIRSNLDHELRSITIFHEIHHAAQTDSMNEATGMYQVHDGTCRLIMEAQTQYFAELTYSQFSNQIFEDKLIPTEELRLTKFGTVKSNLHNYELYDNLLSKLALLLGVSKLYFVKLNNKNYKVAFKELERMYNEAKRKYNIRISFSAMIAMLDYIYVVDYLSYIDNEEKEVLLAGNETTDPYCINFFYHDKLSQKRSMKYIKYIEMQIMKAIKAEKVLFSKMSHYIIDDELRFFVQNVLN